MSRPLESAPVGAVFERLTVLADAAPHYRKDGRRTAKWRAACTCGAVVEVAATSLKRGLTRSCGCLNDELAAELGKAKRQHGESNTASPEYQTWNAMKARCTNPQNVSYSRYGGAGITVCERWACSYEAFLQDMGRKPSPSHTIDRVDSKVGYEPANCRWATKTEQSRNRRNVVLTPELANEIRQLKQDKGWGRRRISAHLNLPMGAVVGVLQNQSWRGN